MTAKKTKYYYFTENRTLKSVHNIFGSKDTIFCHFNKYNLEIDKTKTQNADCRHSALVN